MITFKNDYADFVAIYGERIQRIFSDFDFQFTFVPHTEEWILADATSTPFATNPDSPSQIVYNQPLIDEIGLNYQEIHACVLHEIGHCVKAKKIKENYYSELKKEQVCDEVSIEMGLQFYMISALIKMKNLIPDTIFNNRVANLSPSVVLYRPEWTCGRYNAKSDCSIMYNLIDGLSYYFEDYSAKIIDLVLRRPRWAAIDLSDIITTFGISTTSLIPFLLALLQNQLLSTRIYGADEVERYRNNSFTQRLTSIRYPNGRLDNNSLKDSEIESEAEELFLSKASICGSVMLELTYRCSERCVHCYNPGASRNNKEDVQRGKEQDELSFDDYKSIIDNLYEEGLFKVCLTGGDPFSKSCVWQLIDYLYKKNIAFDVFTNGQNLIGHERELADYYPRSVGLTIYSMDDETHDEITGITGSLKKTLTVASRLAELAIPIYIKCCVLKTNIKSYFTIYDYSDSIGAIAQVDINVSNSIDGDNCVRKYLKPSKSHYEILLRDPRSLSFVELDAKLEERSILSERRACKAGCKSFCVSPTGELFPCCAFHLNLGNLKNHEIRELINQSANYKLWNSLRLKNYSKCIGCQYLDFCPLCSGFNYSDNNEITKPSYDNCFIAELRYQRFLHLKAGIEEEEDFRTSLQRLTIKKTQPKRC